MSKRISFPCGKDTRLLCFHSVFIVLILCFSFCLEAEREWLRYEEPSPLDPTFSSLFVNCCRLTTDKTRKVFPHSCGNMMYHMVHFAYTFMVKLIKHQDQIFSPYTTSRWARVARRFLFGFNPSLDHTVPSISKVILELYLGNLRGSEMWQCPWYFMTCCGCSIWWLAVVNTFDTTCWEGAVCGELLPGTNCATSALLLLTWFLISLCNTMVMCENVQYCLELALGYLE